MKWKIAMPVLGIGCIVALIGARELLPHEQSKADAVAPAPVNTIKPALSSFGTVVPGVVDSEIEVSMYTAPDILPIARVKQVLVKEGQEIQVDTPLIIFDDAHLQAKKVNAEKAVAIAKVKVSQAELMVKTLPEKKKAQQIAVRKAEVEHDAALRAMVRVNERFDELIKNLGQVMTIEDKETKRKINPEHIMAQGFIDGTKLQIEKENFELKTLELLNPQLQVDEAQAEVNRLDALVHEIQLLIDACTLKASIAGIVARVSVSMGSIVSPSMMKPTIIVVPSGKRLVRAEVVPEFAQKISGQVGKTVSIIDNDNSKLVYEGEVVRIGEAYLPPRFASQEISKLNANRVLECTILIKDPAPAGKPPLRVGQPVRVGFPLN